jgi:hypothetical protein
MAVNPPFFEVATVGGQSVVLTAGCVGYIRTDPAAPTTRCFVGTFAMDAGEPWHVDAPADALANALSAAAGNQPGTGPGSVLFAGAILGNGTIAGGYTAPGVSVVPAPYVPGSGVYDFAVNGLGPVGMVLSVTQIQTPPQQAVLGAAQNGPQSFRVEGESVPAGAWGDWAFYVVAVRI